MYFIKSIMKISDLKYQTLMLTNPCQFILHIQINRPQKNNTMNPQFFTDIKNCFEVINQNNDIKVVILTGKGKHFCGGFDMVQFGADFQFDKNQDPARTSIKMYKKIQRLQKSFVAVFNCRVPVIIGIQGNCVSTGLDIACMGDIRYSTQNAKFMMKEVDIGMTSDAGTIQLFPNITGNHSFFRQIIYTGMTFNGNEALKKGFISKNFKDQKQMNQNLLLTAQLIASKSPVAIWTIKQVVNRQMRKYIDESLEYAARMNSAMLLTNDIETSIKGYFSKKIAIFPKL